jgi:S-adenosylmethionine:tRNA ribosyltransferase-isomerase
MSAALLHGPGLVEATAPPERRGVARDAVRLLVTDRVRRTHVHARFFELPRFLHTGDVLVVNDSATLPAAVRAQRSNGEGVMLHFSTALDERTWTVEPRGPGAAGEELQLPLGGTATLIAPLDPERPRLWYARLRLPLPATDYLLAAGEPIRYGYVRERFPLADYQTIFAREPGSAEMPSAARPFTPRVVDALRAAGVALETVTLHCGVASFEAPERPATERFSVPQRTASAVNAARADGRRVIAVGTTALRALESAVHEGIVVAAAGWTDRVIDRDHPVRTADGLLTGFHDATATHLWILEAFLDAKLLDEAYAEAADGGYRYHEFGDVHLIA